MNHIFHLFTIAFIIYEVSWLIEPIEKTKRRKKEHEIRKAAKERGSYAWDDMGKEEKNLFIKNVFKLPLLVWLFAGLFTFNWVLFASMLIFNMVIIAPISRLTKFSYAYTVLHLVNSLIGALCGVFIIINAYHLRIDLLEILKSLI